tara:strand:+ start:938 stop:1147 length:210 start_codon:yes stop_codon:yes gene_type:complete
MIGDPAGPGGDVGVLGGGGTAATLRNFIVTRFGAGGVDIDSAATFTQSEIGALTIANSILFNESEIFFR